MILPYNLSGRDVYEVAMAETAASGGSVYVGENGVYPEVQNAYQRFFREHGNLYDGYQSAAKVALANFFDQVHFLNTGHVRQVHALNRYLADQQIPFDHLTEEGLANGRLDEYAAIILPNVVYLSDAEVVALRKYVRGGGTLIAIGGTGTHDAYCRPRAKGALAKFPKRCVIRFADLDQALAQPGIYLEPAVQAAEEGTFAETYADTRLGKYDSLAEIDRKLWVKRYQTAGPLTEALAGVLGSPLHTADPREASGVRCLVYHRRDGDTWRVAAHVVNKNVPMAVPEEERVLEPVTDLALSLPIPRGATDLSAQLFVPGKPAAELDVSSISDGVAAVTLPHLDAYAVVAVSCRRP